MSMARRRLQCVGRSAVPLLSALLAACAASPPDAAAPLSPHDQCRALTDSLDAAVPPGESIADLQARGVRIRTPLSFAPGSVSRPLQPSGAVVQLIVTPEGTVLPGSPRTLKTVGDAHVASATEAAALSMTFDFDAGARPAAPFPFTMAFAACPR